MLDLTNDHLIFDNKETITFENKGDSPATINNVVRRRSIMQTTSQDGTTVYAASMKFIIYKVETAIIPRVNAKITDNLGNQYFVDYVADDCLRSRWVVDSTSASGEGSN